MYTMTIRGMHCEACKKIITMELEDAGLYEHVSSLALSGENSGTLTIQDGTPDTIVSDIRKVIENIEGYSVE